MENDTAIPSILPTSEPAPVFEAYTTHGTRKPEDYKCKWLVSLPHPADFTPVCTTEFIAFARHHADFQALDCGLLGLSIDNYYSQVAWIRETSEAFDTGISFPIIEDLSINVTKAYGMPHSGTADTFAVHVTFIIDPNGILRAMVYYPMTNGRSIEKFLFLINALQAFLKYKIKIKITTPETWQPDDKTIGSATPPTHLLTWKPPMHTWPETMNVL